MDDASAVKTSAPHRAGSLTLPFLLLGLALFTALAPLAATAQVPFPPPPPGFWPPPPFPGFFKPDVPDFPGFRLAPACIGPNVDCGGCVIVRENGDPITDGHTDEVHAAVNEVAATTTGILGANLGGDSYPVLNLDGYLCKLYEILTRMGLDPVDGGDGSSEVNIIAAGEATSWQYKIFTSGMVTAWKETAEQCPVCPTRPGVTNGSGTPSSSPPPGGGGGGTGGGGSTGGTGSFNVDTIRQPAGTGGGTGGFGGSGGQSGNESAKGGGCFAAAPPTGPLVAMLLTLAGAAFLRPRRRLP